MKTSRKLAAIGLSAVIALLLLVFGIDYLKGINVFHTANYFFAVYDNVTGLSVSAPVHANGFKVGQVREMRYEYDNPGHVRVELALDPELKVPEGTVAVLGSDLLGTATISLEMPKSTDYADVGTTLQSKLAESLMDNVSADLMPKFMSILPKLDSLLAAVTTVVTDPAIAVSVKRLDAITANVNAVTENVNLLTQQVSGAMQPLPGVMNNAATAATHLSAMSVNLNHMSNNLDSLSGTLQQMPLASTVANVEALTENLRHITAQLESRDNSMGLLLNDDQLYNNLNGAVGSLDSLLIDIKAHPKRYISIKLL